MLKKHKAKEQKILSKTNAKQKPTDAMWATAKQC